MNFTTGFPHRRRHHDSILVIVDQMTKSAYFLPIKTLDTTEYYTKISIRELVRLHGMPLSII